MSEGSIRLGSFRGIELRVHLTFALLLLFLALSSGIAGALSLAAIFACVALHELAHSVVAQSLGIPVRDITLWPFGGIASLAYMPEEPHKELLIAVAGPPVNFAIAFLIAVVLPEPRGRLYVLTPGTLFLLRLLQANLVIGLLNLVPAFPLDGGRILRSVASFFLGRARATRLATRVGRVFAVVFIAVGAAFLLAGQTGGFGLAIIGGFILLAGGREEEAMRLRASLVGLRVRDALAPGFTWFGVEEPVGRALAAAMAVGQEEFPVLSGGTLAGTVSRRALARAQAELGPYARVGEVADRDVLVVSADAPLADVYDRLVAEGRRCAVAVDGGVVVGVVDGEAITAAALAARGGLY